MDCTIDPATITINITKAYNTIHKKLKTFTKRTNQSDKILKRIESKVEKYIKSNFKYANEREKQAIIGGVVARITERNLTHIKDTAQNTNQIQGVGK